MSHPSEGMPSATSGIRPPQFQFGHNQHRQQPPQQQPYSMRNFRYQLDVVQQPVRARMCGFGDKDRRPITPPPCIKLRVFDESGQEVNNLTEVDCNFFILSVDLWDAEGRQEQNLVMHPSNTSSANLASSNTSPNTPINYQHPGWGAQDPNHHYGGHHHPHHSQNEYHSQPFVPYNSNYQQGYPPTAYPTHHYADEMNYGPPSHSNGQFTRNLIGSLTASAFRLKDDKDVPGIWFVLQDLSVRTEGTFRLKFSFLNLGISPQNGNQNGPGPSLNMGKSKVLTTAMSDAFLVYSAKKFPGMIESTDLSKKFASQGIRIPVRHAGEKDTGNNDDDDDEEENI